MSSTANNPSIIENVSMSIPNSTSIPIFDNLIISIWLIGFLILISKLLFSYVYSHFLTNGGKASIPLTQHLEEVLNKLNIKKNVLILESNRISVPSIIGYFKPCILFPMGMITQLTTEEIECILIHELAHIKRHDYLYLILQLIVESIYYYHPGIQWMSKQIRAEREKASDDFTLKHMENRIVYAKMLVKLQEIQYGILPPLASSINTNNNELYNRIKRILKMKESKINFSKPLSIVVAILVASIMMSATLINKKEINLQDDLNSTIPVTNNLQDVQNSKTYLNFLDTFPEENIVIELHSMKNGQSMSMRKENGKITKLEIDGKTIPPSEFEKYVDRLGNSEKDQYDNNEHDISLDIKIKELDNHQSYYKIIEDLIDNNLFDDFSDIDFDIELDEIIDLKGDLAFKFDTLLQMFGEGSPHVFFKKYKFSDDPNSRKWLEKFEDGYKIHLDSLTILEDDEFDRLRYFHYKPGEMDIIIEKENDRSEPQIYKFKNQYHNNKSSVVSIIGNALNKDGLLELNKMNKIELTGKHLKINDDKQPKNIWSKYKRIYENEIGAPMSSRTRLDFQLEGKPSDRKIRSF